MRGGAMGGDGGIGGIGRGGNGDGGAAGRGAGEETGATGCGNGAAAAAGTLGRAKGADDGRVDGRWTVGAGGNGAGTFGKTAAAIVAAGGAGGTGIREGAGGTGAEALGGGGTGMAGTGGTVAGAGVLLTFPVSELYIRSNSSSSPFLRDSSLAKVASTEFLTNAVFSFFKAASFLLTISFISFSIRATALSASAAEKSKPPLAVSRTKMSRVSAASRIPLRREATAVL